MLAFIAVHKILKGSYLPTTDTKDIWFYSGLGAMLFSLLFIEPYYTSPKNVLTNSFPLFLVFLAIYENYNNKLVWWVIFIYVCVMIVLAVICIALSEFGKDKSEQNNFNLISNFIKEIIVKFGQGRVLYSAVFFSTLLIYYSRDSDDHKYALTMFVFWFFVLTINPKTLNTTFSISNTKNSINVIGEIFAIQSSAIYLAKVFKDKNNIEKFETIKFKNSQGICYKGFIFDIYELNNQRWIKIWAIEAKALECHDFNLIYKEQFDDLVKNINSFVGVVSENSNILKIKFEYSKKNRDLEEGDLIKTNIGEKTIFYQVVNAITQSTILETKNKSGFIEAEAMQLGEFNKDTLNFDKVGWVPDMYSPLFVAKNVAAEKEFKYPEYRLGVVPKTDIPVVLNLHDAISHHIALIGVTGSGKSFLAREIIRELLQDTKVICVDFNKEFIQDFKDISNIVTDDDIKVIQENINKLILEGEKFPNKQEKSEMETCNNNIKDNFSKSIKSFLTSKDKNICSFELPDLVNTTAILEYTKYFFKEIFEIAKSEEIKQRILIVIEEAHTIIPEWNFTGSNDKTSQSVINAISQIALQGRKYNIGFMVIGQRTANISKTILTQCNTMICFQAFDDTNFNFLGNYIGKDMAMTLPAMKKYHAIVAGKALKSDLPLIVDVARNYTNRQISDK
jgi:hypothetical protein